MNIKLMLKPIAIMKIIEATLDAIARRDRVSGVKTGDWKRGISSGIAKKFRSYRCKSYATGKPRYCDGPEWLFDFCTLFGGDLNEKRYINHAKILIAGEMEWNKRDDFIDEDFCKLLVTDAVVCFFAFQQRNSELAQRQLGRLENAALNRRKRLRNIGHSKLPVFLLSCWIEQEKRFRHRRIS